MKRIREILRLCWENGLSHSSAGRALGVSSSTVHKYVASARASGLSWPLPENFTDTELENLLFPPPAHRPKSHAEPDWSYIHTELKRKGVTLILLWQEYKEEHPSDGYQLSQFCEHYRRWRQQLNISMRQQHRAGEKVFSDFAGAKFKVVDPSTGEVKYAHLFVSTLGASSYTFADVFFDETAESWCQGQANAFSYFGGVCEIIVPDNPKGTVIKPSRYEPDLNKSFREMASHFGCAVIPARVRRPKDKAKVEAAVGLATRWIFAKLRNREFFSLNELRQAIIPLLEELNNRPFKKLPGSRRTAFESIDRPALKPLPLDKYQYSEIHLARVGIDHHVEFDQHWYSVPYQLVRKEVELYVTASTVEILHGGKRIASHVRNYTTGKATTLDDHRPATHREYAQRTPERLIAAGGIIGPSVKRVLESIFESDLHRHEAYNRCAGILRLGKVNGGARLEAACNRALYNNAVSYRSIKAILHHRLDQVPIPEAAASEQLKIYHENIRGAAYFSTGANEYVNTAYVGRIDSVEAVRNAQGSRSSDANT